MGTIDLNDLEVFGTVVTLGSFSRAATQLRLPKSSVSRAIARLEDVTGIQLLHRTTRQVALSAEGKFLYERIRDRVTSLRHSVADLPELKHAMSGRLRITSIVTHEGFFAELVSRFIERHPAMEIDLHLTSQPVDLIAEGMDVALRFSARPLKGGSSLSARKLYSRRLEPYASPAYVARRGMPQSPLDLDQHEWVVYNRATEFHLEGNGPPADIVTRGRIVCNDGAFVRAAVLAGCGLGYLSKSWAEPEVAAGRLVRVMPGWNCRLTHLWAVWPGPHKPSRKVAAFIEVVVETLKRRGL